jgi:hypothetical protein
MRSQYYLVRKQDAHCDNTALLVARIMQIKDSRAIVA